MQVTHDRVLDAIKERLQSAETTTFSTMSGGSSDALVVPGVDDENIAAAVIDLLNAGTITAAFVEKRVLTPTESGASEMPTPWRRWNDVVVTPRD